MPAKFVSVLPVLSCALMLLAGCGNPPAQISGMVDVKGKVTVQGKPADNLSMTFYPVDPTKGREDVCLVSKGEYVNKIMPGVYKITFETVAGGTVIPNVYKTAATSKLQIDASSAKETDFDLK